jgi:predicted kinase
MGPVLIIFAGLPGSGKTTLAHELAKRIDATYLRIDSIEQALARSSLKIDSAEDSGYEAAYALAEDNLRLGRIVVADSVNPIELTRSAWLDVAQRTGVPAIEVEVICSDDSEHKERVETRTADIEGHMLPTWQEVIKRDYEPWNRERVVIDTANRSVSECVEELTYILAKGVKPESLKARVY